MERCVRCVMPVTAKGMTFDKDGVCRLCAEHEDYVPRGEAQLRADIEKHVRAGRDFNCVVPVSGGRDSSYALYYAVRALGLRPLAVHSDNDFETETAARNLEAITKRLDVPLIRICSKRQLPRKIVSEKIRMNAPFGARLVVDQICEACQIGFEAAARSIARKNGIALILWGDSRDESTASYHKLVAHPLPSTLRRLLSPHAVHLINYKFYVYCLQKEYGAGPRHPLTELHLYDYIRWDPAVIVGTIQRELGWSAPEGAPTTWRIDCSLIPLVNYLTEKAYGVSKIELGFSSMVRNGKMARGEALTRLELIRKNTDVNRMKSLLNDIGIPEGTVNRILH